MPVGAVLLRLTVLAVAAVTSFTIGWLAGQLFEAVAHREPSVPAASVSAVGAGGGDEDAPDRRRHWNTGVDPPGPCNSQPLLRRRSSSAAGGASAGAAASPTAVPSAAAEGRGGDGGGAGGGGGLDGLCAVCMANRATVGFQHGSKVHCCVCGACWREMARRGMASRCPMCNQRAPAAEVIGT